MDSINTESDAAAKTVTSPNVNNETDLSLFPFLLLRIGAQFCTLEVPSHISCWFFGQLQR